MWHRKGAEQRGVLCPPPHLPPPDEFLPLQARRSGTLNLQIMGKGEIDTLKILGLPLQDHGMSPHLFTSSRGSFSKISWFSLFSFYVFPIDLFPGLLSFGLLL